MRNLELRSLHTGALMEFFSKKYQNLKGQHTDVGFQILHSELVCSDNEPSLCS